LKEALDRHPELRSVFGKIDFEDLALLLLAVA
jgi:hypothetical protein